MDVLKFLDEANKKLEAAQNPPEDKIEKLLAEMVGVNKQLIKALEREVRVDNKINVPKAEVKVNVPETKIENVINPIVNPIIEQPKLKAVDYKVVRNRQGFIDRVESKHKY